MELKEAEGEPSRREKKRKAQSVMFSSTATVW